MLHETDHVGARQFKASVEETKSRTVGSRSPYNVSLFRQVYACTKREFELTLGDKITLYIKFFIKFFIISISFIVGSLFYQQAINIQGDFSHGSTIYFPILFFGMHSVVVTNEGCYW